MLFGLFLAVIFGIFAGTVSGLFPGIHINLVAAGLLALISSGSFLGIEPLVLAAFVVAMAITHTFLDFIPSIFLGAPEEDSFLSVLPGHQLLKEGKGHEAVVLTLYGGLVALPIIVVFSILFVNFLSSIYEFVRIFIPYILIFVSLYLVLKEEEIILGFVVFVLAGFLGLFTFELPVREPLLPLLSGLFGISGLILSVKDKIAIPKQEIKPLRKIKLDRKSFLLGGLAGGISAPLCSFLPGIGSGHAAVIGSEITGELGRDKRVFLFILGVINPIVMALSFVTVYSIGKARTGAAVAVQEILGEFSLTQLISILGIVFVSGIISFFIGVNLSKFFCKNITKLNYSKLSFVVIFIVVAINLIISNFYGLIVLITASALGVFTILSRVRRINLMGCLLVPTIVFYLTM